MNHRTPKLGRRGFSLAEVVVGSGVLAMFMVGLPLAVRMARNAVPDGANTASSAMDASRVMELLASDIAFATSVNSSTAKYDPTHLTITVPDQNGDGLQETIAYTCSPPPPPPPPGPPVQTLTRQFNSAAAVTLLNNVQEFNFTYDTLAVTGAPGTNQGGNTLLASLTSGSSYTQTTVNSSNSYAQYVEPILPANATSWNLTQVQLQMLTGASGASALVQIRPAVGGLPAETVLGQVTLSSFPSSMNWQTINFSGITGLSPYAGICIVVISASGTAACSLNSASNANNTGGSLTSRDGGNTWSQTTSSDFLFQLNGQINTSNNSTTTSYYLKDVRVKLRTNQNNQSRIVNTIRTYNQPQVPHQ